MPLAKRWSHHPGGRHFAVDYPGGGTPPSNPTTDVGGTQVKGAQVSKGSSLPFTGDDVAGLAAIGGGAAAVGGLLVTQSRRRRRVSV